jgi:hypothetical protein
MNNKYQILCNTNSDINEHLPVLKRYAEECEIVTEMGIRYVVSTWAFLSAKPKKIISYDILTGLDLNIFNSNLEELKKEAEEIGTEFQFHLKNVLDIEIDRTDLLFIDTYHEYNQIKKELELHSGKVNKYIILHDTTTFGEFGETFKEPNTIGIWPAIIEFLEENKEWCIKEKLTNNNGLTILEKKL